MSSKADIMQAHQAKAIQDFIIQRVDEKTRKEMLRANLNAKIKNKQQNREKKTVVEYVFDGKGNKVGMKQESIIGGANYTPELIARISSQITKTLRDPKQLAAFLEETQLSKEELVGFFNAQKEMKDRENPDWMPPELRPKVEELKPDTLESVMLGQESK